MAKPNVAVYYNINWKWCSEAISFVTSWPIFRTVN